LSLTALSKTDHYSATFELPFVPVFVLEAPHFIAEFATNKPLLSEEKKTHFIVVLFQKAALGGVLKTGKKKAKPIYIAIQRTWDRGDVSFLRVGVQGQDAMRWIVIS